MRWIMLPDGERAALSPHAVADYVACVRPGLEDDYREACIDLQRLVREHGHIQLDRPDWMAGSVAGDDWSGCPRWVVAGDVAILVQYPDSEPDLLLAAAVVARGSVSPQVREARSERHRGRRARRRGLRRAGKAPGWRGQERRERRDQLARESDQRRDDT